MTSAPTAQEQVNQVVKETSVDHEARIRQVETAVITLSAIAAADKDERSELKVKVNRLERLSYLAIGAYGILGLAMEIYRTFKGHI